MMRDSKPFDWIDSQSQTMRSFLIELCNINSYSFHVAGVRRVIELIRSRLNKIADDVSLVEVPAARIYDDRGNPCERALSPCLVARKRADAHFRVLLNIHADTVYPESSPFQQVKEIDSNTLNGPGVVDAKGGIVVLLAALEAFEQSPLAANIGWEVIINSDEEIGSPGSRDLLDEAAKRNQVGVLFEPAMAEGGLVSARKGSGNFTIVVRGRAAHAGRNFEEGRNAVVAAAEIALALDRANARLMGTTINVGRLVGGDAPNVVPDVATLIVNCRATEPADVNRIQDVIFAAQLPVGMREGFSVQTYGSFSSMPKVLDEPTRSLLNIILDAGSSIGLKLKHGATGGASDGNRLAAAGLPNIDSLGPRGGQLHSDAEFIKLDSLTERAKLSLAVLCKLAENAG